MPGCGPLGRARPAGGAKRPFKFPIRLIKQGDGHEEFYDPVEGGKAEPAKFEAEQLTKPAG
jgi:hypothetical protein